MKRESYEKILKKLKERRKDIAGIEKESIEYKIKQIELKIKEVDDKYRITTTKIVSKEQIIMKINKEKNIIKGYLKIMMGDTTMHQMVKEKMEFAKIKVMMYEKELPYYDEEEPVKNREFQKTTGSIMFEILSFEIDPIFEVKSIRFYVDLKYKGDFELKVGLTNYIVFEASSECEIILLGDNNITLGIIYLPCDYFINMDGDILKFDFRNFNYLNIRVSFKKDIKLLRKNADIVCIYREGHGLENAYFCYPKICGVCSGFLPVFSYSLRCFRCKFTCHKECSRIILFSCKNSEFVNSTKYKKSYEIKHKLTETKSSGFRYCNHCGDRIPSSELFEQCDNCCKRFHISCEDYVFDCCGIYLELRSKMAEFQPSFGSAEKPPQKYHINDFILIRVLGRGNFGKVLLVEYRETGQIMALKVLKKEKIQNVDDVTYIEIERKVLRLASTFSHPFLIQMYLCFQDDHNLYFGIEYLSGGDLFHHTVKNNFCFDQIRLYACEILLGLEFLHKNYIIYRDMKLDNILLANDGHVKICDFGLCKEDVREFSLSYTYCGTMDSIAPEIIKGDPYTKAVDWWSYGVLLYELYEKKPPFLGATNREISTSILQDEPEISDFVPADAKELILKLLCKDPEKRYGYGADGIEKIKKHSYFCNINWNDVYEKKIACKFIPGDKISNFDEEFTSDVSSITPTCSQKKFDYYFSNFK